MSIEVGQTRNYPPLTSPHTRLVCGPVFEAELDRRPALELPGFHIGKHGDREAVRDGLRGRAGARQVEVNSVGPCVRELAREDPEPGRT